jgi:4-diphosphocytidyl-2-C-methyl-D-erythritol kinase
MTPEAPRRARVRALAKINLSLKVLNKRPDGFHELRTIFQTISLGDRIDIEFTPSRRTRIELESSLDIPNNLVVRSAEAVMDAMRKTGQVSFRLKKRIPMGGGLGGGSSNAAAVLLALPVLAGRNLPLPTLTEIGLELGSDVPYFLLGGTALGLGRGGELHPLPEPGPFQGLAVIPDVHVSTAEAYRALGRELTFEPQSSTMSSFQALSWMLGCGLTAEAWAAHGENDFESSVYEQHPELNRIRRKLKKLGAKPVMLSGSGSSVFGIFESRSAREQAARSFRNQRVESIYLVSRARYRKMWWRSLMGHLEKDEWPPQSRYAR